MNGKFFPNSVGFARRTTYYNFWPFINLTDTVSFQLELELVILLFLTFLTIGKLVQFSCKKLKHPS